MKKLLLSFLTTLSLTIGAFAGSASAAGSASLSLSPASGTFTQGNSYTITIYENGSDINAVTAKLTYDPTKLTCTGVSVTTSTFAASSGANCASGAVTIGRYVGLDDATGAPNPSKNGSQVVGSVTFKAVTASGTTNVSFASGSQVASEGANVWDGNTSGGTYSLVAAPVATTPTGSSTGGTSTTSTSGTSSTSGKTTSSSPTSTSKSGSSASTTSSTTQNGSTNASSSNGQSVKNSKEASTTKAKHIKSRHSGFVTPTISALVILAVAFYMLVIRKRVELKPVTAVQKLISTRKSNTAAAKKSK